MRAVEFRVGMWVKNPNKPDWGIGEVLEVDEQKLRILFSGPGEKQLSVRFAALEQTDTPEDKTAVRPRLRARSDLNVKVLESICRQFHEQFKDRRSNTDDGRMAIKVMDDINSKGDLSKATAKQLFAWCHTGVSYAEGVELAQNICRLIYGRVPTKAELELAGFV